MLTADKYHHGIPQDHLGTFASPRPDPHPGVMPAAAWTRFHGAWAREAGRLASLLGARMAATLWLVSTTTGSNANGGTSQSVLATGTDGIAVSGHTTLFTSISATWTSGLVGQGVYASSSTILRLISAVQVAQSVASATTTNTQTTLTSSALFNATMLYCAVSGPGIAAGTYISAYTSTSSMTLSAAAGAGAGSGSLVIGPQLTTTGTTGFTAATGQTWNVGGMLATVNRALVTASGAINAMSAGDSVYVGAGVYRETVAVGKSGSSGSVISVIGDVDGAQTGVAGQATITAYTTNNTTTPSSTALLALGTQSYLAFSLFSFIGGNARMSSNSAGGGNYSFTDCVFNGISTTTSNNGPLWVSSTTGLALGITIDRCVLLCGGSSGFEFSLAETASGAADYDALCIVRNTLVLTTQAQSTSMICIEVTASGSTTYKGGGVRVYNCTLIGAVGMEVANAGNSTSVPCEIHNSFISANTGLDANTSGQLLESYNLIYAGTARTNVTAGTGSISNGSYAPLVELGQSYKWGAGTLRQFLAPDGSGSPLLGFGSDGSGNDPTVDWQNRPRPSGGGSASYAVGFMEFHDFAIEDTVTYNDAPASGKLVGPGDQFIRVPVDATASTISIYLYQGAGYTGTTYATATILANGELGITTQTETCTSSLSSWQQLTFTVQTPSKAGWVTIQVTSFDTSGTGTLNFDTLGVS